MTSGEICECGRPKWTADDLQRWNSEICEWQLAVPGRKGRDFNPDWARGICWTHRGVKCPMRPLNKENTNG